MSSTGQPPAGAPQPVPAPVFGSTGLEKPGVGFVFVGMGPYARQLKCETAIESLRRHAGWGGPVFLITDAPQCFEGERWGGCGLNATVVAVEGEGDLAAGFTVPSLTATKGNRLRSKSYKMRIFELIPDPAITTLVFMDCDILSADAPGGCLEAFLAEYAREDRFDADRRIWLFPENDDTKIQGVVHSGFFVAHREWSAPLLARWHDQLMTFTDHADQAAFVRAGITEYRFMDEPRYFYRPRCDRDDCPAMPLKCFNHINGARCIKQGADSIQTFIDRWELCSLGDAQYCTPLYMEPFAKSWLPYTTCRKMEEGLFGSWSGKKAQSMRVQSW
ncbi:unnamed protein product [Ostreobium quekettii]|uniref:Nucleotide-diphospho-sugar transferase domain-containing protein n=1 Tax=Ostreobium quekettii TaxID=121088 RepID=A0A8S1IQ34_9CHLO|nr:unnamed protein product [Ostreobium quekettii]